MCTGWEQFQNCEKLKKVIFVHIEARINFFFLVSGPRFPTLQMLELEQQSNQSPRCNPPGNRCIHPNETNYKKVCFWTALSLNKWKLSIFSVLKSSKGPSSTHRLINALLMRIMGPGAALYTESRCRMACSLTDISDNICAVHFDEYTISPPLFLNITKIRCWSSDNYKISVAGSASEEKYCRT